VGTRHRRPVTADRGDRPEHAAVGGSHDAGPGCRGRAGPGGPEESGGQSIETEALEEACRVALSYGAYRLRTVRSCSIARARRQQQFEFLEEHPVIRPLSDYSLTSLLQFRRERKHDERHMAECLKKLRLSGMAQYAGGPLAGSGTAPPGPCRVPGLVLADEWHTSRTVDRPRPEGRRDSANRRPWRTFHWTSIVRSRRSRSTTWRQAASSVSTATCCWPGRRVGKSHLVQAIGHQLVHAGFTVPVPLDLRRRAGLPPRRGLRGPPIDHDQISQAGPVDPG